MTPSFEQENNGADRQRGTRQGSAHVAHGAERHGSHASSPAGSMRSQEPRCPHREGAASSASGAPNASGSSSPARVRGAAGHAAPRGGASRGPASQGPERGAAGQAGGYNLRPVPDLTKTEEIIRVRKKRKKPSKGRRAVLVTLVALVCVVGLAGGAVALYLNSLNQALSFDDKEAESQLRAVLADPAPEAKEKPFYMLLLGSDAREGDVASRSDVMILLRVDQTTGQLTMVSIPRDTMVDLPGYGRSKINAAYAYGGAAMAVEAVNKFAGISISHYAEIHFEELEQLVDALGGVWVNVPVSNNQTGSSNTGMAIEAGEQLLTGEQALAFARERYGYERGDFQRADNQKLLLQAIIKQVLSVSPIDLPGTIQQLAECITTDYSITDIIALAQKFQGAGTITFYSATVPSSTTMLDGVSYVVTDQTGWTEMMQRVDMGADPNAQTVATQGDSQVAPEVATVGEGSGSGGGAAAGTETEGGEG